MRPALQLPRREGRRGAALVIALAVILALTVLVACSRVQAVTQFAESRSQRDYERALQLAEAGLNAYLFGTNGGSGSSYVPTAQSVGANGEDTVASFVGKVRATTISETSSPKFIRWPGAPLNEGYYVETTGTGTIYSFGWCNGVARRIRALISQGGIVDSVILAASSTSLTVSGHAEFGGTVHVDSSSQVSVSGSGTLLIDSPAVLDVRSTTQSSSGITGAISTSQAIAADPYASMLVPDPTGMTNYGVKTTNSTETLQPGHYTSITIQSGSHVTMNPGIYYIDQGFTDQAGSSSSLTGSGVMIYNADKNYITGQLVNKGITISGGSPANLSPPTSGTYAGIMLFERRDATSSKITVSGASGFAMAGAIYAAGSDLVVSGSSGVTSPVASTVVVATMTVTGSGTVAVIPTNGRYTVNTSSTTSGTQWTELAN